MLLTDGAVAASDDLTIYESSIQAVASSLGIDLTGKLTLAKQHLTTRALIFLRRNGGDVFGSGNIVVTPELRHWLMVQTLAEAYRDAYHSDLNDRYGAKWKVYAKASEEAEQDFYGAGIGVVFSPLPRPGVPDVRLSAGSNPGAVYYVRTAWVGVNGDESAASDAAVLEAPAGYGFTVTPGAPPAGAAGFRVYAGDSEGACVLQTPTPQPLDEDWNLPPGALRAGAPAGDGQEPDRYILAEQRIWKG